MCITITVGVCQASFVIAGPARLVHLSTTRQILDNGGVKCWGSNANQQLDFLSESECCILSVIEP